MRNIKSRTFAAALAIASMGALPLLPGAPARVLAAPAQTAQIQGTISVVDAGGKRVPQITLADGRVYIITGKLEKLIRDQYNGKPIKLSGKVEQEAAAGKPGLFRVEEIAVQLN